VRLFLGTISSRLFAVREPAPAAHVNGTSSVAVTGAACMGGLSPGAPRGPKNGNYKNGDWTAEAIEERKWLRLLVKSFAKSKDIR